MPVGKTAETVALPAVPQMLPPLVCNDAGDGFTVSCNLTIESHCCEFLTGSK